MSFWRIHYYQDKKGRSSTREFLEGLKVNERAKAFAWISQLEAEGPNLPRPYADLLEDGIHELRVRLSGSQVRVLYFFCYREFIVLTHAFVKTTSRVPAREIRVAKRCRADFLSRYSYDDLKGETDGNL